MSDWHQIAKTNDISNGEHKVFDLDGTDIIIFHHDGGFYALEDVCSHDGSEISSGCIESGCIICPRHGARFDIKTGEVKSAPAYEDIEAFELKVDDQHIFIKDHRW